MGNDEQIFKSNGYQWSQFNIAYSGEGMKQAPTKYMNVHGYLVAANTAIEEAGIEGVNKISINENLVDWIFRFSVRRDKLESFTQKVHMDVCTLIDNPFTTSMDELKNSATEHAEFTVNYNNEVFTLGIDEVSEEYVDELFKSIIDSNDIDSKEYTGDENVDRYIREYQKFDPSSRMYGYEIALDNYENLNANQKEALRHMIEYNFRVMEKNVDKNSAEAMVAKATLNNMNKHMFNKEEDERYYPERVTGNAAAKGLLSLMDKDAHSYELLEAVANMDFNAYIYDEDGTEVFNSGTATLTIDYDKAGISLYLHNEITFHDDITSQDETYSRDYRVGYYTSLSRCRNYVAYQEKIHPGCYDHLNGMGISDALIADYLVKADSKKDMNIIDRMTKSTGQSFDDIFKVDPDGADPVTISGMEAVVFHNMVLTELYRKDGNLAAKEEAIRMNRFLMGGTSKYSEAYYNYYNAAEYQMIYGDLTDDTSIGAGEAYLRGIESEFIVWPRAINAIAQSISDSNIVYMSMDDMSDIRVVTYNKEDCGRIYLSNLNCGSWVNRVEGESIQDRLSYYKYVGEVGGTLTSTEIKDLKSIYYSYLNYAKERRINLEYTERDQTILNDLYNILYKTDSNFKTHEDLLREEQKISEAEKAHPIAFGAGKVTGDIVIYAAFTYATGGFGGGLEGVLGSFTANVAKGTFADIIIKDLPRAITSYSEGEDLRDVAASFTQEVVYDIAGNVVGEYLGNGIKYVGDKINATEGMKLVNSYMDAADKPNFLKNLTKKELRNMISQMDDEIAAEVLSRYSDDAVRSVLGCLDPAKACMIAGNLDDILYSETKNMLSGAVDVDGAITQGKNIKQLDVIDESAIAKHLDGTVDNIGKDAIPNADDIIKQSKGIQQIDAANGITNLPEKSVEFGNGIEIQKATEFGNPVDSVQPIKTVNTPDVDDIIKASTTTDEAKDAGRIADEILNKAKEAEPKTTDVMRSLEDYGGHLEGLEYRLKSQESLERKLLLKSHLKGVSVEEAALEIDDSLRYTLVSSEVNYNTMVADSIEQLQKEGFVLDELKNSWGDDVYQGINAKFTSPEGVKLELQFHTEASYYTKETLNHNYYEIARSEIATEAEKAEAIGKMIENQSHVDCPEGVMELSKDSYRWTSHDAAEEAFYEGIYASQRETIPEYEQYLQDIKGEKLLDYKPSSGATLKANPDKTTTILGVYTEDTSFILDETGTVKSLDFGPRDNDFNMLNTPDE